MTVCVSSVYPRNTLYVCTYRLYVQTYSSTYVRKGIPIVRSATYTLGQNLLYVQITENDSLGVLNE